MPDQLADAIAHNNLVHRVTAVLHRWYCFYERDEKNFDHQRELITDDFVMVHPLASDPTKTERTEGVPGYFDSLRDLPPGGSYSHRLESLELTRTGEHTAAGFVTHSFEVQAAQLSGTALLRYDFEITQHPAELLPRLSQLTEQIVEMRETSFSDSYPENRATAFLYHWLAETDGAHRVRAREFNVDAEGNYILAADLDRITRTESGQPMVERAQHTFVLAETGERYPKLGDDHQSTVTQPEAAVSTDEALDLLVS